MFIADVPHLYFQGRLFRICHRHRNGAGDIRQEIIPSGESLLSPFSGKYDENDIHDPVAELASMVIMNSASTTHGVCFPLMHASGTSLRDSAIFKIFAMVLPGRIGIVKN